MPSSENNSANLEIQNEHNDNLRIEILKTIIRFDIFYHPLSPYEIHKFLGVFCDYSALLRALDKLASNKEIIIEKGFYCLPGRVEIISERFKRLNYFNVKIKKALRFTRLISLLPFIKGVFVSNIVGDHNLRKQSDIDFLIISSAGKIWISRFFCTALAKILGLRPNKKTKENKICLSFYISCDNLNLEKYLYNQADFYFINWLVGLEPIFFKLDVYKYFWESNIWIKKYLPNFSLPIFNFEPPERKKFFTFNFTFNFSFFSKHLNRILKKYQLKIMPKKLKDQRSCSAGVILEDNIIKLFLEDKRPIFIDKFNEMSKNLLKRL